MPNGDLAYHATKALLESGVTEFVLVGAGGSFKGTDNPVGSYQMVQESHLGKQVFTLDDNMIGFRGKEMKREYINPTTGTNTTVSSPLVENDEWLSRMGENGMTSVDVETAHIFKALIEHVSENNSAEIKVVPGLFTSDVLGGKDALDEKIDPANAGQYQEEVLKCIGILRKAPSLKAITSAVFATKAFLAAVR